MLEGDGYFTALDLSDDGSQVIAGVAYLEGGKLAGKIVVYDFSDSGGSGREDQMKGGITPYEGENLISEVRYFRNGRAFAASTRGLCFFQVGKNGIEKGWKLAEKQEVIRSLCFDRNYVAIVLNEAEAQDNKPYRVELYNSGGDNVRHLILCGQGHGFSDRQRCADRLFAKRHGAVQRRRGFSAGACGPALGREPLSLARRGAYQRSQVEVNQKEERNHGESWHRCRRRRDRH